MHNGDAHDGGHDPAEHGHAGRAPRGFRETFLVPLAIPLAAGITIFAVILSVSQILLAVPETVATPIALCIALIILLSCAYLATTPTLKRQTIYSFIAVPAVILFGLGIFSGAYRKANPKHEGATQAGVAAPPPEVTTDNKFSVTSYTVEAGKATTINVSNKGAAIHNFDILNVKDPSGNPVKTDLLQPGTSASLTFTLDTPGTYNFQCDVHPTEMTGTIVVTVPSTAAGGQSGGLTETTTDNKFSQTNFSINHGDKVTLTVQNKGAAIHNFHVMGGAKDASGNDIMTALVPPGQTASLNFEIDTPGSYPFQCDVHPTEMIGTLVVK